VFVLPSFGGAETWGLAVNEAMCMSRPVIVSDHVGCARDLVVPHSNGLVFPASDTRALSRCLLEALSDRARLRTWGERSRVMIEEFSYSQATKGLLEALRVVLRDRHPV
jgi:glycosyltransferase involved in cell wall biosynthesis